MDVILSTRARQDLSDILLYTDQTWGKQQRNAYRTRFLSAFAALGDNPHLGTAIDDFGIALRVHLVERHILYYRIGQDAIELVRILHERRDAARHISE